jgi:hypothetical protein
LLLKPRAVFHWVNKRRQEAGALEAAPDPPDERLLSTSQRGEQLYCWATAPR